MQVPVSTQSIAIRYPYASCFEENLRNPSLV